MVSAYVERYQAMIRGEIWCFDRVVITGSLPDIGHARAMEACTSFRSWTDKKTGHTRLKPVQGKCLHCYFYGHHWLARRLGEAGIDHTLEDNAFIAIDDIDEAQRLSDGFDVHKLHRHLDRWARTFCPASRRFRAGYH